MNKRIYILISLFFVLSVILAFLFIQKNTLNVEPKQSNSKLTVVTTFYPLKFVAEKVGGDMVEIVSLTPAGGEPHDYEPTPQDIIKIQKADIFVLNGAGFEPWAEKLVPQLDSKKTTVVKMSDHIPLLEGENISKRDPHFWLDPQNMMIEARVLGDAFMNLNQVGAPQIDVNITKFLSELETLQQSYVTGLKSCTKNEIVVSHNAFAHLAKKYGFGVNSLSGMSPNQDATPKHIAELAEIVRTKNIGYILTETLASPKFAETLASETGVQVLVLNPLEGLTSEEIQNGQDYLSIMKQNLINLQRALGCG